MAIDMPSFHAFLLGADEETGDYETKKKLIHLGLLRYPNGDPPHVKVGGTSLTRTIRILLLRTQLQLFYLKLKARKKSTRGLFGDRISRSIEGGKIVLPWMCCYRNTLVDSLVPAIYRVQLP